MHGPTNHKFRRHVATQLGSVRKADIILCRSSWLSGCRPTLSSEDGNR